MKQKVNIKLTGGVIPTRATEKSACYDLRANLSGIKTINSYNCILGNNEEKQQLFLFINPGGRALIPTGNKMDIPKGYEGIVRPRSGLAIKHGITIVNTPGTIDEDYKGDVGVILINHGELPFKVEHGDRIAQFCIRPVTEIEFVEVDNIEISNRGEGGFGHTGTK